MASEIGMIGSHDETQSEMMGEMCLVVDIDDNVIDSSYIFTNLSKLKMKIRFKDSYKCFMIDKIL